MAEKTYEERALLAYKRRYGVRAQPATGVVISEHMGKRYVELNDFHGWIVATYRIEPNGRLAFRKTALPGRTVYWHS